MANNVYDMMRAKAKSMGHAASKLPDSVWEKYMKVQDKRSTLREAKLYVENYMMGNLDAAEFAMVMAEDNTLRYAISDLCRLRLEPVDLDISRNNSFIDLGAGIKTFWTEIRVPLPSEIDAARDIRNINYGIEAGRATAGVTSVKETPENSAAETETVTEETAPEKGKKRTLREFLSDAKKHAAEVAIEKLTPIAEGKKETVELDETWLETEEGREYKDAYTREAAQEIENTAMSIEAGVNTSLEPEERIKALKAAGIPEEKANEMVNELFSEQDMEHLEAAEDMNETVASHDLVYDYSPEELNRPLNDEMQELFDQIIQHVDQDQKKGKGRKPGKDKEPGKDQPDVEQTDDFAADYYEQLAKEMDGYQSEDFYEYPVPEDDDDIQLSPEECARIFEEGMQQLGM